MNKKANKLARNLVQLQALRLEVSKQEKAAKEELHQMMLDAGNTQFEITIQMNNAPVTIRGESKTRLVTVIDTEKLSKLMTEEQFKSCAKVTLKDAKEVLPEAMISKCSTSEESSPSLTVKAVGNLSVPEIHLY